HRAPAPDPPRPCPRRPPRRRPRPRCAGALPRGRARLRRGRRRPRLLPPRPGGGLVVAPALPVPAAPLGWWTGADRRGGERGRRDRRLPRPPLPGPRARPDRALAGKRPPRPGERRDLHGGLDAVAAAARGRGPGGAAPRLQLG